ncbi:small monomeric GTPase [Entamoeba marina]
MSSIKIVVLGPAAVGKSAITIRLVKRIFTEQYDPTIEDCFRTTRTIKDNEVVLDILDTAGQDEFISVKQQYMTIGNGFLIVYSIISKSSFEECKEIVEMLLRIREKQEVQWLLVGNKVDLEELREVTTEEANIFAEENNAIKLIETSAKKNINVEESFLLLTQSVIEAKINPSPTKKTEKRCLMM